MKNSRPSNERKYLQGLKRKPLFYHFIAWAVFIVYEVTLVEIVRRGTSTVQLSWLNYAIPYCVNIAFFYLHALILMQFCFGEKKKRPWLFFLLLIVELCVFMLVMGLVTRSVSDSDTSFFAPMYPSVVAFSRQLWRCIYFLIFSSAYWLIRKSFREVEKMRVIEKNALLKETERQSLELKLVSTENAFLQAQINPHLLFNALNFIHSEVQDVSPKASEAIITLADMMRYSLAEVSPDGKVPLEKEMEQIENLIQINQFRFNNELCIEFEQQGNFEGAVIIPLLLLPFVENLFKYAELTEAEHPAVIQVALEQNSLSFNTFNKKRRTVRFDSHGIGIENVKMRLENYYPGSHSLQIEGDEKFFAVHLNLQL